MISLPRIPYLVDTLCQFVLLCLLVGGSYRKRPAFSIYILLAFVADLVEDIVVYGRLGWRSSTYRTLYWTDHVALDLILFLVVIVFTYQALGQNPFRQIAAKALAIIAILALVLPFVFLPDHHGKAHGSFDSQWFNHTSQILNFGAAIMNVVLWTALLTNRKRDPELVTLSIGVGILTTSAAIAWGARQWLSEANRWPVDIFMTAAHLSAVILWCWLFRPKAWRSGDAVPPRAAPPGATPPSAQPQALTTGS